MQMFSVGDLVEFRYYYVKNHIGVVMSAHKYTGYLWYRIMWNDGAISEVSEIELKKVKTDK